MATCRTVSAVLPPTVNKRVLFSWRLHLQETIKVQKTPEAVLYLYIYLTFLFRTYIFIHLDFIIPFGPYMPQYLIHCTVSPCRGFYFCSNLSSAVKFIY